MPPTTVLVPRSSRTGNQLILLAEESLEGDMRRYCSCRRGNISNSFPEEQKSVRSGQSEGFVKTPRARSYRVVSFARTWDQTPNFRYLLLWSSDGNVSSRLRGISFKI